MRAPFVRALSAWRRTIAGPDGTGPGARGAPGIHAFKGKRRAPTSQWSAAMRSDEPARRHSPTGGCRGERGIDLAVAPLSGDFRPQQPHPAGRVTARSRFEQVPAIPGGYGALPLVHAW